MVLGCASGARSVAREQGRTSAPFCAPTIQERPLVRRIERLLTSGVFAAALFWATAAGAQEPLFARLNLDKLQLVSLGVGYGRILPSQIEPTDVFSLQADYGEIARSWRVVFGVSYWDSRY